jgi:hypothetical protein
MSPAEPIGAELELAVRLFRKDFRSTEPLSEEMLALCLAELARDADLPNQSKLLILSVALALKSPAGEWQLKLKRAKPGQSQSWDEWRAARVRDAQVFDYVETLKAQGWKNEAAVADARQIFSLSRSAIFACCKRYKAQSDGMRRMIKAWRPKSD